MKKLLILLLFLPLFGFSQLNSRAQVIKENSPRLYETIKKYSENKWNDDYQMVIYTINKQADAFMDIGILMEDDNFDGKIWFNAIMKWADNPSKFERLFNDDKPEEAFETIIIQWDMVLYTYKKQLEAKLSY